VKITWRERFAPLCIWLAIYLVQAPAGLNANNGITSALFGQPVIAGLILEIPLGLRAVGLDRLHGPPESMGYVEKPDPNKSAAMDAGRDLESTVWLIVGRVRVLRIGYSQERTFGRRLALLLVARVSAAARSASGYAMAFFGPRVGSGEAIPIPGRSGGTIFHRQQNSGGSYGSEARPEPRARFGTL